MQKTTWIWLAVVVAAVFAVFADGFAEDKFVKKYAMMKIYESCFGSDVVRQIRKELKAACAKCAATASFEDSLPPKQPQDNSKQTTSTVDGDNSVNEANSNFDLDKLHQAILAFRPTPYQQATFRPYAGFYPNGNPFMYPSSPGLQAAPNGFQAAPFAAAFAPQFYPAPSFYATSQRSARNMEYRNPYEMMQMVNRMSGRNNGRNVTCVMQELGYINEKMEPNYAKIQERIGSLPVAQQLKDDIKEGVVFCQQFSQCVPEVKRTDKTPLFRDIAKPMLFFRCYKHKKLEACIMQDVRERMMSAEEMGAPVEEAFFRAGKSSAGEDNTSTSAEDMFELLYGADNNNEEETDVL